MGGLILCRQIKADQPYFVKGLDKHINTIEELCFFLYYHTYLLDPSIMEEDFINWIKEGLSLPNLADELKMIAKQEGIESFAVHILQSMQYRTEEELVNYKKELMRLSAATPWERAKQRADYLVRSRNYSKAIRVYQQILKQTNLDVQLQGYVYHNLGVAYGSLFDFEQSSKSFIQAFQLCPNQESLKQYKLAIRLSDRALEEDELAKEFPLSNTIDQQIEDDIARITEQMMQGQVVLKELSQMKEANRLQDYYAQLGKILHQWQDECRSYTNG